MWFVFKEMLLPETMVIKGPPARLKEHADRFREKYRNAFEKGGNMYASISVSARSAEANTEQICATDYFKEKVTYDRPG